MTAIIPAPRATWFEQAMISTGEAMVRFAERSSVRRASRRQAAMADLARDVCVQRRASAMEDCALRAWNAGIR